MQNPSPNPVTCATVCGSTGGVPAVTGANNRCVSGGSRPAGAINTLGSGNPPFYWGCANGACSTPNADHNITAGNECYNIGQPQNHNATDRIVGCYCQVPVASACTTTEPPTITVTPTVVRPGDTVEVQWDPKGNTDCTLSAPLTGDGSQAGSETVTATTNQSVFTISCDGNSVGTTTLTVIPTVYES